jgi:hypothetical protein
VRPGVVDPAQQRIPRLLAFAAQPLLSSHTGASATVEGGFGSERPPHLAAEPAFHCTRKHRGGDSLRLSDWCQLQDRYAELPSETVHRAVGFLLLPVSRCPPTKMLSAAPFERSADVRVMLYPREATVAATTNCSGWRWSGPWSDEAWSECGAAIVPAVRRTDLNGRKRPHSTCRRCRLYTGRTSRCRRGGRDYERQPGTADQMLWPTFFDGTCQHLSAVFSGSQCHASRAYCLNP